MTNEQKQLDSQAAELKALNDKVAAMEKLNRELAAAVEKVTGVSGGTDH